MKKHHIILTSTANRLCMMLLPWRKDENLRLPMRLFNSFDIFQQEVSELKAGLQICKDYPNNLLLISKENFGQHLKQLEQALTQLPKTSLINALEKIFCKTESKY